ncbi:hypothetical protein GGR56DRAFT_386508 [Xylariaceae sp. FL0804]|nr:hypothetical protein GGR56DRAFT_386508 [Xylariaceae sp. FL0804]
MPEQKPQGWQSQPPEDSSDDDSNDNAAISFSEDNPGDYRGRARAKAETAQYPARPEYSVDQVVYLMIPGRQGPAGPFVVVSIDSNNYYTLKRQDNGQIWPEVVPEDRLVVPNT